MPYKYSLENNYCLITKCGGEKSFQAKINVKIYFLQELIRKYAGEVGISESQVSVLLETLRTHALQKLAEREKFKSSGIATLRIKIAGGLMNQVHL